MKKFALPLAILALLVVVGGVIIAKRRAVPVDLSADRAAAWTLFQNYITAAKNHDLETVSSLSYQISDECKKVPTTQTCIDTMDNAFFFGKNFATSTLTNTIGDKKQIILFMDYVEEIMSDAGSRTRGLIYFVRDNTGALKFLSFKPFDGAYFRRINNEATSTVETRLREMTVDTDGDTLADEFERCEGQVVSDDCVKTNPLSKDTDRDGWWDSIEALFYK